MESISDTIWDVVICGTGLQQSLLALALSRSEKKILHIDPNEYYGGAEASLSLDEADAWAAAHEGASASRPATSTGDDDGTKSTQPVPKLAASRLYSLALAPQFLHARSALVDRLVASRAYRQLEFLAVSSFFVLESPSPSTPSASSPSSPPSVVRIPATREDVFAATAMPARAKRQLMKFLKFVLAYNGGGDDGEEDDSSSSSTALWQAHASEPLGDFLQTAFNLDGNLRDYVLALTLSLDGANVTVAEGLARLHRHITSMGVFGPGFAAVYPKWGGCSEIAQVACRASAVGGAVYMLGAGIRAVNKTRKEDADKGAENPDQELVEVELTTDVHVKTKLVVSSGEEAAITASSTQESDHARQRVSRLVAVISDPLSFLFAPTVEGAPVAGGSVIAIPAGRPVLADGSTSEYPIFAIAHSSDTGECPPGQSVLYLTTVHVEHAKALLDNALASLLAAFRHTTKSSSESSGDSGESDATATDAHSSPSTASILCLYKLYFEQYSGTNGTRKTQGSDDTSIGPPSTSPGGDATSFRFPPMPVDLTVPDASLEPVRDAWKRVIGAHGDDESYMVFEDREGNMIDDDYD